MSSQTATASAVTPRIELRGITKIYPAVVANKDVSLTALPGEIHAVLGENGAGKSTLMKIIYGVVKPDAGEVRWEGKPVTVANPAHARELGIGMVFQHFSLFETLTVVENVALALPGKPDLGELAKRITEVSERYGLPVDPRRPGHRTLRSASGNAQEHGANDDRQGSAASAARRAQDRRAEAHPRWPEPGVARSLRYRPEGHAPHRAQRGDRRHRGRFGQWT